MKLRIPISSAIFYFHNNSGSGFSSLAQIIWRLGIFQPPLLPVLWKCLYARHTTCYWKELLAISSRFLLWGNWESNSIFSYAHSFMPASLELWEHPNVVFQGCSFKLISVVSTPVLSQILSFTLQILPHAGYIWFVIFCVRVLTLSWNIAIKRSLPDLPSWMYCTSI